MNKTKLLVVTLLAGIVLRQTAWCQTNAIADAATAVASGTTGAAAEGNATAVAGPADSQLPAGTNSQPVAAANAAAEVLPIQFSDVSISAAIEALARKAGINYLLDPKIGYGQPDQNGQPKPEPTLSVRWENVTARQALMALLDNYGLQLIENPKTGIDRITTKEPNALPPLVTRVIQLKYASTSNMMSLRGGPFVG